VKDFELFSLFFVPFVLTKQIKILLYNVNVYGIKITDQRLILEEFNTIFSQNLVKEFSSLDYEDYKIFLKNKLRSSIFMESPRVNEVTNLIYSLNLRKSVGHDNISPYFLRIASTILQYHQFCVNLLILLLD